MRAAEGALFPAFLRESAHQRLDGGRFERLCLCHFGEDAGEPCGQHGLTGPRWAGHQHAVVARRGDFQCTLGQQLSLDVGEVRVVVGAAGGECGLARQRRVSGQVGADLEQGSRGVDIRVLHQGGFAGALRGQDEGTAIPAGLERHRQRAAHWAQLTGQGQLARKLVQGQPVLRNLPAGGEDAEGNGQVEAPAFLVRNILISENGYVDI